MALRNIVLLTGLAVLMAACTIPPGSEYRDYNMYNGDYYDYRNTPAYEGYYYARIIFIRNVPYYVDDNLYVRPIPPRYYEIFRGYPYDSLGYPLMFSPDPEVREGYPMSRIVYFDGVPYHVEKNRIAQPLPERLRPHFGYMPANPGTPPANINRPQPFIQHDNGQHNGPPVFEPYPGNDRNFDERGQNGRNHERIEPPPFARGPREGGNSAVANPAGMPAPFPTLGEPPLHQHQPNAVESHTDTPNVGVRDPNVNRPKDIAISDKKKNDQKKSRHDKKDKHGNRIKTDDSKEPQHD